MKNIIIVGCGSVGLEVYSTIDWINSIEKRKNGEPKYNILGFIDDLYKSGTRVINEKTPLLGSIEDWKPLDNEIYALGISDPKIKEKVTSELEAKGCIFETIIAPNSLVSPDIKIGRGCFITAYSISGDAVIGNFVNVQASMIGGTAVIGDFCTTLGFANIANGRLGKRVYVGSQAVILNVKVEDDAIVCVGSIVVRNVKAGTKVFGNPAKKVDW